MRSSFLRSLAATALALAAGGCGNDSSVGEACDRSSDCPGVEACDEGRCVAPDGSSGPDGGSTSSGGSDGGFGGEDGNGPIRQVRAGRHHTCTRMHDASIYCWGQGAFRALGGDYSFQGLPRRIEAIDDGVEIGSGRRFGCAVRSSGEVWCWGENDHGQVATHDTIPCGDCTPLPECATSVCVATPQRMDGLDGTVELALGGAHGCARRDDGSVLCWGDNTHGQVGHEDIERDVTEPHPVPDISGAEQVVAGIDHTCALIGSPGEVKCWGNNERAQVGNGDTGDAVPVPAKVAEVEDAVEIIAGGSHTCARRQEGSVVCWGYNYLGALGNGSTRPTRATSIEQVEGLGDAVQLAAGQYFTCALRADGTVACWGDNRHGQLGDGTAEGADCADRPCRPSAVPVMVVRDAVLVDAGHLHACAADAAGTMWCWGYNLGGQLGTGDVDSDPTPVPVEVEGLPD